MYCPKCLSNSLYLKDHGVIQVIINKKQMDAGRFLYNLEEETKEELIESLEVKLEEFFKWYSNFNNKKPIETIELVSADIACDNRCPVGLNTMLSVIDILVPSKSMLELLNNMGKKYNIKIAIIT